VVEHIIHHKNEVQMDRQMYRNLNRWTAVTVNGHKKDEWGCQVITFKKPLTRYRDGKCVEEEG